MVYLLTGAGGFIGSKVAEILLCDGHIVIGIDNMNDSYDVRLKEWRVRQIEKYPGFHFYKMNILNRQKLQSLYADLDAKPAAVIHLAAQAGVRLSVADPWRYLETNITGTLNLLELCRENEICKFVFASTSSLYGANGSLPLKENANTSSPLSPYAASKKAAEMLCYTYHHLYGIDVTVLRYFTVYGPAGRPDMSLFRFVQWIIEGRSVKVYGDGTQSRDFNYVDDIARGTVAGLKPLGYEIINLGMNITVVLMDAIKLIEELVGKKAIVEYHTRRPADILTTWADTHKAQELLDWKPQIDFREGVKRMIDWYQANRDWTREIKT